MQEEFQEMILAHSKILYKIGRVYCSDNMDFNDLQQEMMLQLWKSFKLFKGQSKRSTWVYRVCLNTAISYLKKVKKQKQTIFQYEFSSDNIEDSSDHSEKENMHNALYGCINGLKKDEKAVILLYLEEKKYREIAEILGISESLVGVKISRIKSKLEKCIKSKIL